MKTSIHKLKNSQAKLSVELDEEELIFYVKEAEKRLANDVRVNGFRKGKVPPDIARSKIDKNAVRQEALDLAVKGSASQAISDTKLDVIEYSGLKITDNSANKLTYEVILTVFPDIRLGDYKELRVDRKNTDVHSAEVDNVIKEIQKSRSSLELSSDPSQKGDRVEVDFVIKNDGKDLDGGKSENHPIILGEGKFVPGFEDNIIGLKVGEKKSFLIKAPSSYHQKSVAGKQLDCSVEVKKVDHVKLPEINDEFIKGLGRFNSILSFKENIQEGLKMEKEQREKDRVRVSLLEQVLDKSHLEAPEILVQRQLDSMLTSFDNELHQKGMELSLYLAHINKTQADLRSSWEDSAVKQVKMALISKEIAKKESIKVSDEELESEFNTTVGQFVQSGGEMNENKVGELKGRIYDVLLNEKVFRLLENNNRAT